MSRGNQRQNIFRDGADRLGLFPRWAKLARKQAGRRMLIA